MADGKIVSLMEQSQKAQAQALKAYEAQMEQMKQPFLLAFQRREITRDDYEMCTGETVTDTLTKMYDRDIENVKERMKDRVTSGYITEEEYQAITGEVYTSSVDSIKELAAAKLAAIKEANAKKAEAEAAAAAKKTETTSKKKTPAVTVVDASGEA